MDRTKRTSSNFLRATVPTATTLIIGAIISHFFENHTQTTAKVKTHYAITPNTLHTQTSSIQQDHILASLPHQAKLPSTEWIDTLNNQAESTHE